MKAFHAQLIEQAEHLAQKESRRPKQASIRRSVSASYYAVFHCLNGEFTSLYPPSSLAVTCRQLNHVTAKIVAGEVKKGGKPECLLGCAVSQDLMDVCSNFILLQQLRHEADYDVARKFKREEAVDCFKRANLVVANVERLRRSDPLLLRSFVLALVFNPKVAKR
jgi:uncharacterized protein (UPF0332 family)